MNPQIPSFVFRRRAWLAIKPWLQVLIVVGLLVVLPGLCGEVASTLLNDDMTEALTGPANAILDFMAQEVPEDVTQEQLLEEADTLSSDFMAAVGGFIRDKGWILLALGAADLLLTPVFLIPLYGALLDAYRKKELTIAGCLRYLKLGPKALLLTLWTALRTWVWMLPGMAAMMAGLFLPSLALVLLYGGFAASMVLGVRALLHYILAPIVLVEEPGLSLNGCIRRSWEVMRTRKMEFFMLRISFVGWELLLTFLGTFAVNQVMMAIILTVTMMGNLLLTIYVNGATVVFWDTYGVQLGRIRQEAADMGVDDPEDLN